MKKQTYLNLNFDDVIYPSFPQSVKAIINWFSSREDIVEGLVGMSGEGATTEEVKKAFNQVVPIIIQHDPRKLYEFFDDQDIVITIATHIDGGGFVYYNSAAHHSHSADTRIEAEEKAFIEAFKILEKRLQDAETERGNNKKSSGGE